MFNTMTVTKAVGALFGALLIFLLGNMVASWLYRTGGEGKKPAYVVAGTQAAPAPAPAAAAPKDDFAKILAAADVAKGEKIFHKCKACHKIDGNNATGPHLDGVVGRAVGTAKGFNYSKTLAGLGGKWEPARLNEFLTSPKTYAPGTKMGFSGLKKITDRADVIAYLTTLSK